jgi:hypothetical protein
MALIRKAGYGLCMESTSKRLMRLQSGWFKTTFVSSALSSRTTANQYSNDEYQFTTMITACREWLFYASSTEWVAKSGLLGPQHFVAQGFAPSLNADGGTWINECTIGNVVNRLQVPSTLSSFTISGARLLLESPGETHRYKYDNSSDINISDEFYCPNTANNYRGLMAKVSSTLQPPGYLFQQYPGIDIDIDADTLNDNTSRIVGVESHTPFTTGIAMPRFGAGAWSTYNFSSTQVTWLNTHRDFYLYLAWDTMYPSYVSPINYSHRIYSRSLRGLRLEVYCTV